MKQPFFICLLTSLSLVVAPSVVGQPDEQASYRSSPFSVTLSRISTGAAPVGEKGNELQRDQWMLDAKVNVALNRQWSIGASVGFDSLDYDWRSPTLGTTHMGDAQTWDKIERYKASLSLAYRPNRNWMFIFAPKLQYAYADTASSSNAESYGAVLSGMYRFDSGNMLGFGVAYLNDIDEVRTVPFLAVNWRITDKLSLGNPFSAGFSGPAGLELRYQLNADWNMGIGTSKRTNRFLIADKEQTAEIEEWVSFARVGWDMSHSLSVNAYAGYFFNGELELNPQNSRQDIDNQGAAALDVTLRF